MQGVFLAGKISRFVHFLGDLFNRTINQVFVSRHPVFSLKWWEREALAMNPDTDPKLLKVLSYDELEEIRVIVAENHSTPGRVLNSMVRRETVGVIRLSLASNIMTPVKALKRLAGVKLRLGSIIIIGAPVDNDRIGERLAENISTPLWLLEFLIKNDPRFVSSVSQTVAMNPNVPEGRLKDFLRASTPIYGKHVKRSVSRNPGLSEQLIEQLSHDSDSHVRTSIAAHPRTPAETLERLSYDVEQTVLMMVGANPNTPISVLERMAGEESYLYRISAKEPSNPYRERYGNEYSKVRERILSNPAYVEHQRGKVLGVLGMDENVLPVHLLDEIWQEPQEKM